jgi:hypothetical protein
LPQQPSQRKWAAPQPIFQQAVAGSRVAPVPAAPIELLVSGLADPPVVPPALPNVVLPEPELMPPLEPIALEPMLPEELPVPGAPRALLPIGPDEVESLLPGVAAEPRVLLPGVVAEPRVLPPDVPAEPKVLLPVGPELPIALLPVLALPGTQGVPDPEVVAPVDCARARPPAAANDEAANSIVNVFLLAFMCELLGLRLKGKKKEPALRQFICQKARIPAVRASMPTPLMSH